MTLQTSTTYKELAIATARGRILLSFDAVIYMESGGKTVAIHTLDMGV